MARTPALPEPARCRGAIRPIEPFAVVTATSVNVETDQHTHGWTLLTRRRAPLCEKAGGIHCQNGVVTLPCSEREVSAFRDC